MRFAGKTAVVTGSGRPGGLGEAVARRLADAGVAVVISDIGVSRDAATPDGMIGSTAEMAAIADSLGAKSSSFACDVRDPAQIATGVYHRALEAALSDIPCVKLNPQRVRRFAEATEHWPRQTGLTPR